MRWASDFHTPVMAHEVVELLRGSPNVLDGTLGGGGHSLALLEHGAMVTALDRDPQAVAAASARLREYERDGRVRLSIGNFADLDSVSVLAGQRYDAILLDLGVSSRQLDDPVRGFSFRQGSLLDMRMGEGCRTDAAAFLGDASEEELAYIFRRYGDEPRARRLAREVVRRRVTAPFTTSEHLVNAIRGALGARTGPADFARLFQAVRIAVNDELESLESALPELRDRLVPGGSLAVISYHSGEDRLVKHAFRSWSSACVCPPRVPVCTCRGHALGTTRTPRALVADSAEVAANPRARSARLRAWRSVA